MHHLASDAGRLMYSILWAVMDGLIGWLLTSCDLAEHRSPSVWLPSTRGPFYSVRMPCWAVSWPQLLWSWQGRVVWFQCNGHWVGRHSLVRLYRSHHFVFYLDHVRESLAKTPRIDGVTIPPNLVPIYMATCSNLEGSGGKSTAYSIVCIWFQNKCSWNTQRLHCIGER